MESYSLHGVIEQKANRLIEKYVVNPTGFIVINGADERDYFVLRNLGEGYNFVSIAFDGAPYFTERHLSLEECVKRVLIDNKTVLLFENVEEFCRWYLTEGKRTFSKIEYEIIEHH